MEQEITEDLWKWLKKGELVWNFKARAKDRDRAFCISPTPTQESYPDLAFLSPKSSSRWKPRWVHSSFGSNGSPSDNIRQAQHHWQGKLPVNPTRIGILSPPQAQDSLLRNRYKEDWAGVSSRRHNSSKWPDLGSIFVPISPTLVPHQKHLEVGEEVQSEGAL